MIFFYFLEKGNNSGLENEKSPNQGLKEKRFSSNQSRIRVSAWIVTINNGSNEGSWIRSVAGFLL